VFATRLAAGSYGVENPIQLVEVLVVLAEQRARQHVAQQQHDADHLVRLDAARDDALRQVAGVRLQRFERSCLERFHVVVVHRGRFGEDFLLRHGREELRPGDTACPLFPQLRPILAEVRDQLAQQRRRGL